MNLINKKVLVYGLGVSGISAAKLLIEAGAVVSVYDDDKVGGMPANTTLLSDISQGVDDFDLIVVSPSVPLSKSVLKNAVKSGKVIGELELAYGFLNSELIAVTGTNGKTTVTLLINDMVNKSGQLSYALGNVGIPLSESVLEMTPTETAVVEVSTFQLETVKSFSPDISVLTNVTCDHLDRHLTRENYVALKARIFEKQINRDVAIINADDETSMEIAERVNSDLYFFSTEKMVRGAYVEGSEIYFEDKGKIHIAAVSDVKMQGKHNLRNALAAVAAAVKQGVNPEIIKMSLKTFDVPDYRMTYLGEARGKKFYNDSKGTNISATLAAAESLDGNTVLIVGGRGKGENYADLFKNLPKNVIHTFVTGENAAEIVDGALRAGVYSLSSRATLSECVRESACVICDNVLFSPASSSFDAYSNFKERGKAFDSLFGELL